MPYHPKQHRRFWGHSWLRLQRSDIIRRFGLQKRGRGFKQTIPGSRISTVSFTSITSIHIIKNWLYYIAIGFYACFGMHGVCSGSGF